jgi:hypothetical protein
LKKTAAQASGACVPFVVGPRSLVDFRVGVVKSRFLDRTSHAQAGGCYVRWGVRVTEKESHRLTFGLNRSFAYVMLSRHIS